VDTEPDFIELIGLSSHLSQTRSNGLNAMIDKIQTIAG
ncbi:MAG: SufE family protein, partial [Proteobacteria bacterium]